jgi:hypothetical protein
MTNPMLTAGIAVVADSTICFFLLQRTGVWRKRAGTGYNDSSSDFGSTGSDGS